MTRHGMTKCALTIGLTGLLVGCSGAQTSMTTSPSAVRVADSLSSQATNSASRHGADDSGGAVDNSGPGSNDSGRGSDDGGRQVDDSPNRPDNSGGTATLRIKCEQRSTPARARVSVDGTNLPAGSYSARIASGGASVTSALRVAVGDEVEFDFDSNRNDIAAGATAISTTFIQGGTVTGALLNSAGTVVATLTESCLVR